MRAFCLLILLMQNPLQDAVTLVREHRYQEAQQKLNGETEPVDIPQRIAFHRLKAAIAAGLSNFREAAQEMRLAHVLAPSDTQLSIATAVALVESGAAGEAVSLLNEVRRTSQDSALLWTVLGVALYAEGESKDAQASLTRAIHLDERFEPAYRSLAVIALESSSAPSVEIQAALCRWSKVVCAALDVRRARETSDGPLADRAMDVLRTAPANDSIARCSLGQAYAWRSRLTEARTELERCVALSPTPQNRYRLALVYKRLGESELARRELAERAKLLTGQNEQTAIGTEALQGVPR
jgi:predicted Zn-dependent protease